MTERNEVRMTAFPHLSPCRALGVCLASVLLLSCSDKQEVYPSLVTEMSDVRTDSRGMFVDMTTDDGRVFGIANTNISGFRPDAIYRFVVGYTQEDGTSAQPQVLIRSLARVTVLADSTERLRHDATGIESMWAGGKYINMQMTALTQGGDHTWGYAVDSVKAAGQEDRLHTHHYLSIHHNQGTDPQSYSETYYCSLPKDNIPDYQERDTITVAVHTFDGVRYWSFFSR